MRSLKLSIRDLLWLLLVIALALGWWIDHPRVFSVITIDRTWHSGDVSVEPFRDTQLGIRVKGEWPNASSGIWFRYQLFLVQEGSPDVPMAASVGELSNGGKMRGEYGYSQVALSQLAHPSEPHRIVVDYEIWRGKPGRGQLLTKQSVFSEMIEPP